MGFLKGEILRIPEKEGLKIPHMGWNSLEHTEQWPGCFGGLEGQPYVYFVHSYYLKADDEAIVACFHGIQHHISTPPWNRRMFLHASSTRRKAAEVGLTIPEKFCIKSGKEAEAMFTKRIIPCLDVNNGRVVKGVNFVNLQGCR